MRILNAKALPLTKQEKNNFLPGVIDRILAICKSDLNFPLKDHIEKVESDLDMIQLKMDKQNKLLEKSEELEKDFQRRTIMLEAKNLSLQEQLLESLGSEL